MASRLVLHQQAVLAVADDFRQAADMAGDHRDARRHGQQRGRAQAFAVRDVDEQRRAAADRAPGRSENCSSTPARRAASSASAAPLLRIVAIGGRHDRGVPGCGGSQQRHAVVDHADLLRGHAAPRSASTSRTRRPRCSARRARTSSASRQAPAKATRRETTSGAPPASARQRVARGHRAHEPGRAGARAAAARAQAQRLHASRAGARPRRAATPARASSVDSTPGRRQPFDQPQHLPLAAAHLRPASRCRMRISSCFSLWSISETCRTPPCRRWSGPSGPSRKPRCKK